MALSAFTFILVVLFGSTAWMGTNSVWMQLPLITALLPEAWTLPSYLAAVVQLACIGPLLYGISHKCLCNLHTPTIIIGCLILLLICSFLLIPFWDVTVTFSASQYSGALFALMFGIALVNSTSNVLFMPFMAQFHPTYLTAYFVGMGLSSFVPSILSLIQGGSNYECVVANNSTKPVAVYSSPRFSVSTFFFAIAVWTVAASISFLVLYLTGAHKAERKMTAPLSGEKSTYPVESPTETTPLKPLASKSSEETTRTELLSKEVEPIETTNPEEPEHEQGVMSVGAYWWTLALTALVNAQMNGVVPSVHSFAALPYSQSVYHFGVTLSNIASPLASFLPFFVTTRSVPFLSVLTLCSTFATIFLVILASSSPFYFANSYKLGAMLAVLVPVVAASLHSFLRVQFASLLREGSQGSEKRLFWCGVFIQIGSFVGSGIMFPLVNFAHVFSSAPECR